MPALEAEAAGAEAPDVELHGWRDDDGPLAALAAALSGVRGRVGIEKPHLSVAWYELARSVAPAAEWVDGAAVVGDLRLVKDDDELAAMRRAAAIVDRALARLVEELRPGRTEADLAARAGQLIRDEGADGVAFEPIVAAGAKSALPHGNPDSTPVVEGDLVVVDMGAKVAGYCSDLTRTLVAGREPDARQRELFDVVREAQATGVRAAVAGATGADVDRAARSVIEAAGLGESFVHRTGHGLGLEVHEPPSLHSANLEPLLAGTVVTVEPGVYLPGYGGVRIEDDVVVRSGEPEVLTQAPIALEQSR